MRVVYDEHGRAANGFACCAVCQYAYAGAKCDNPGCWSNMSPARKAETEARIARKKAEEAERARIRRIRYAAMVPARGG